MPLRMRQICLVAHDLAATEKAFADVLDLAVCFRDPAVGRWGLENFLSPVGFSFLEVVAPMADKQPEETAAGRYLERRKGDGGYMVILQASDDLHPRLYERLPELGVRIATEMDYGDFRGVQLHPRDVGGAILSIDRNDIHPGEPDRPDQPWHPAGTKWPDMAPSRLITGFRAAELQSADPEALARRWSEVLDRPLAVDARAHPCLELHDATLRFVEARDGRGEGLGGLDLVCADPAEVVRRAQASGFPVEDDTVTLCGMRLRLV
ncbi:MAG: VOC family protein [Alphaproteobacteria bacterium]|nr:VOC family protein [Alphaproteobacteria bacterium]MCB9929843.1 VOC family protein [Alphaproteobacteria bacterium]